MQKRFYYELMGIAALAILGTLLLVVAVCFSYMNPEYLSGQQQEKMILVLMIGIAAIMAFCFLLAGIWSHQLGEKLHLGKEEDNELNAEIAETLLSDEGANLTVAEDGLQAVRMFQEKPEGYFDAILMDIMMPVMDGLTATKTIRSLKHPDAETIPIIAMTANAFQEDAEKCIAAGMNAHLAKPLDIEKVKMTIYKYI